jgi:hypothetical protein
MKVSAEVESFLDSQTFWPDSLETGTKHGFILNKDDDSYLVKSFGFFADYYNNWRQINGRHFVKITERVDKKGEVVGCLVVEETDTYKTRTLEINDTLDNIFKKVKNFAEETGKRSPTLMAFKIYGYLEFQYMSEEEKNTERMNEYRTLRSMGTFKLTNDTLVFDLFNAVKNNVEITFNNRALNEWQKRVVSYVCKNINTIDNGFNKPSLSTLGEISKEIFVIRYTDGEFGKWFWFEDVMNPCELWGDDWSEFSNGSNSSNIRLVRFY